MNNTTSLPQEDLFDEAASYAHISCLLAWSTLTFCLLGICSNLLSMRIFAHSSMRTTPINLLLFGVSFVDLCLCFLAIFVFTVPEFFGCFRSSLSLLISTYAFAYIYPLSAAAQTASIWLFLVVTYERWNAVCGSSSRVHYSGGDRNIHRLRQQRNAIVAVLLVIGLSLAYNLVRFFEFRIVSQHDPNQDITSLALADVLKNKDHPSYGVYMTVYYIVLFLLTQSAGPFIVMVLVNVMILRIIYVARQRRRQLLTRRERKEHNTSLMMAIVILMFLACHTPAVLLNVIESINPSWFFGENVVLAFALNDLSNFILVLNASTGALVYYNFNKPYHDVFVTIVSKALCWNEQRIRRNTQLDEGSGVNGVGLTPMSENML